MCVRKAHRSGTKVIEWATASVVCVGGRREGHTSWRHHHYVHFAVLAHDANLLSLHA